MFSTSRAASRVFSLLAAIGFAAASLPVRAEGPHLTLNDIDELSRNNVVRQLKGSADSPSGSSATPATLGTPLPTGAEFSSAPKPPSVKKPAPVRSQAEPVTFVGAYSDATGGYVLYEMAGGVYPAHLGTKLMNGWTAEKVSGYLVTVSENKRVWTEPIRGGSSPGAVNTPTLQAINDLGGPLPPGGMATPVFISPGK
ncbi:hypothetical protein PQR34_32455 [Paraburkholderia sediminicola]|uniref:hypothetical protein n=1 Tax=Paraburkholderia sediminicola TaxID=458836 RepID=UPI0038BB2A2B